MTGTSSCPGGTVPSGHELGGAMPGLPHERRVLRVRDRDPADPKRRHLDHVPRALVGGGRVGTRGIAAHPKRPGRDEAPLDLGHVRSGITGRTIRDG